MCKFRQLFYRIYLLYCVFSLISFFYIVNIMKKKLSKRQLDVMKVLWDHSSPMVASDIVNGSPALNINTVQSCLKVLLKENLIEVADIVYSGTVLSRSYRPLISRDEYFNTEYKDIIGTSSTSSLIAAFIKEEQDASELERLEQIIQERKKEIEEIR